MDAGFQVRGFGDFDFVEDNEAVGTQVEVVANEGGEFVKPVGRGDGCAEVVVCAGELGFFDGAQPPPVAGLADAVEEGEVVAVGVFEDGFTGISVAADAQFTDDGFAVGVNNVVAHVGVAVGFNGGADFEGEDRGVWVLPGGAHDAPAGVGEISGGVGRVGQTGMDTGGVPEEFGEVEGGRAVRGEPVEIAGGGVVVFDREFAVGHAAGELGAAVGKVDHTVGREVAVDGEVHSGVEPGVGEEVNRAAGEAFEGVGKGHGGADAVVPVAGAFFPGAVVFDGVEEFCKALGGFPDDAHHFLARGNVRAQVDVPGVQHGDCGEAHVGDADRAPVAFVIARPTEPVHPVHTEAQPTGVDHIFQFPALVFREGVVEQVIDGRERGVGVAAVQVQEHEFVYGVDPGGPVHDRAEPFPGFVQVGRIAVDEISKGVVSDPGAGLAREAAVFLPDAVTVALLARRRDGEGAVELFVQVPAFLAVDLCVRPVQADLPHAVEVRSGEEDVGVSQVFGDVLRDVGERHSDLRLRLKVHQRFLFFSETQAQKTQRRCHLRSRAVNVWRSA